MNKRSIRRGLPLALAVLSLAACGGDDDRELNPSIDEARATEMAENVLQGFNEGDYQTFSRDWSTAMKDAIKEGDFKAFRDDQMAKSGRYESIKSVDLVPAQTAGHVTYVFLTEFEKEDVTVRMTLKEDGELIEGLRIESAGD